MLRTDRNIIESHFRTRENAQSRNPKRLGRIRMDSAHITATYPNGALIGTFLSIPIYADHSLSAGQFVYQDLYGSTLESN